MLRLKTFGGFCLDSEHGSLIGAAAQRRRLAECDAELSQIAAPA